MKKMAKAIKERTLKTKGKNKVPIFVIRVEEVEKQDRKKLGKEKLEFIERECLSGYACGYLDSEKFAEE